MIRLGSGLSVVCLFWSAAIPSPLCLACLVCLVAQAARLCLLLTSPRWRVGLPQPFAGASGCDETERQSGEGIAALQKRQTLPQTACEQQGTKTRRTDAAHDPCMIAAGGELSMGDGPRRIPRAR